MLAEKPWFGNSHTYTYHTTAPASSHNNRSLWAFNRPNNNRVNSINLQALMPSARYSLFSLSKLDPVELECLLLRLRIILFAVGLLFPNTTIIVACALNIILLYSIRVWIINLRRELYKHDELTYKFNLIVSIFEFTPYKLQEGSIFVALWVRFWNILFYFIF